MEVQASEYFEDYVQTYYELRKHKGMTLEAAKDFMSDVNFFGTMMVRKGHAHGMVSGAVHTTQATIRPAFEIIKTKAGFSVVSSVFFMCLKDRVLVYGDCAINPDPDAAQLAEIAIASAQTAGIFDIDPRVAMLSYSTGESGKGEEVEKVRQATQLARDMSRQRGLDLKLEGPIQYDAAIDPTVAKIKMPDSEAKMRIMKAAMELLTETDDADNITIRQIAQRAGVGFIGKHTNLIHRQLGNWFFLAEILTTLELEPDGAERNRCGHCVRCLAACPTGAITAPFQLDARRCISYLTIELKGSIPEALRPAIGDRIFGCDDCLAACPWNRFAREGRLMRGHARADLQTPGLVELLSLDEAGFKRRFAGTPLLRARRRGLLRNVCVALGNRGDISALPALQRAANDPEPLIAEHAAWARERIQHSLNR